jgi:hypothetical protein
LRAAELLSIHPGECLMPVMVPDMLSPTEEMRATCVHIAIDLHEVRTLITDHIATMQRP